MKRLNQDLKNQEFKQIYLLYGEESYLKKMYRDKLREALVPAGDTMNYSCFEGKQTDVKELISLADTLPFFADRRLIVVENSGFFKSATPELADYLRALPASAYFVFVEDEVDKRGKMFKAVKDKGYPAELGQQNEKTLSNWILSILKKEGKNISGNAMELFLSKAGSDMENISRELEKLICYTIDKDVISAADVEAVCTTQVTNKIFDMINAMADRRQKRALDLYYDLLTLKEPPMRILFLIARQFQLLLQVKDMQRLGFDKHAIGKKVGLHSFVAGKYMSQARSFSKEQLHDAMRDCADTEEAVKSGRMNDIISVELLIVKYSA